MKKLIIFTMLVMLSLIAFNEFQPVSAYVVYVDGYIEGESQEQYVLPPKNDHLEDAEKLPMDGYRACAYSSCSDYVGEHVSGTTTAYSYKDVYYFVVNTPKEYSFFLDPGSIDVDLELYSVNTFVTEDMNRDLEGNLIGSDNKPNTYNESFSVLLNKGIYFVKVEYKERDGWLDSDLEYGYQFNVSYSDFNLESYDLVEEIGDLSNPNYSNDFDGLYFHINQTFPNLEFPNAYHTGNYELFNDIQDMNYYVYSKPIISDYFVLTSVDSMMFFRYLYDQYIDLVKVEAVNITAELERQEEIVSFITGDWVTIVSKIPGMGCITVAKEIFDAVENLADLAGAPDMYEVMLFESLMQHQSKIASSKQIDISVADYNQWLNNQDSNDVPIGYESITPVISDIINNKEYNQPYINFISRLLYQLDFSSLSTSIQTELENSFGGLTLADDGFVQIYLKHQMNPVETYSRYVTADSELVIDKRYANNSPLSTQADFAYILGTNYQDLDNYYDNTGVYDPNEFVIYNPGFAYEVEKMMHSDNLAPIIDYDNQVCTKKQSTASITPADLLDYCGIEVFDNNPLYNDQVEITASSSSYLDALNVIGNHDIYVKATDKDGNTSNYVAIHMSITDGTPPVITLKKSKAFLAASSYGLSTAEIKALYISSVTDNEDTTPYVTINANNVNWGLPGTYKIYITARDDNNNYTTKSVYMYIFGLAGDDPIFVRF
ncbi:hypothetical protein CI105_01770 [Candidatus Izimaplasma bacterium ZiA1]|uniref:hypothetical protein n=1 Tax=Candidatus Izimoplasma sp. ZiA1 TaxID=2024899 RepID=UPI000BAA5C98|nr:hypothetical protein CI105_01770 [Candidatus Izimaplasma bacterium ZiA1]